MYYHFYQRYYRYHITASMADLFPIILASFSGLVALAYFLLKHLTKQNHPQNLPHGNMGWPLVGETLGFLKPHKSNTLGSFLQQHCSRYGKVFKSHLFGSPTIVSCDYDLNMFILQNEGKLFPVDYPKVMHNILGKLAMILITGDIHKKLRSTAVSFVSASKSDSHFLHCVEKMALSRINSWENCKQVCFYAESKKFSINVMLKTLLNIDPEEPLAFRILENFENYMKGFVSLPLNLPGTTYSNAVEARVRLSSIVHGIIIERRTSNVGPSEGGDHLNVILSKGSLSDEEMVSVILDLLFGGYETTAKLLSLIVYFLGQAPNIVLETLKEEHRVIRESKRNKEALNWEDYKQMEFTQDVVNEALRCGNVVKFLHRKAVQDVHFKEFVIPSGWKVLPILSAGHSDPSLHENPLEFNPFRWKDNSTSKKVSPFGGGPRLCPGLDLAKVEMAFFLHHLVLNYRRWKIKEDDYPLAFPYVDFTKGLQLELEPTDFASGKKH